jgi:hypothetical protein
MEELGRENSAGTTEAGVGTVGFESSGYVAKLGLHIKQWADRAKRRQGGADEEELVTTNTRARPNLSSAVRAQLECGCVPAGCLIGAAAQQ